MKKLILSLCIIIAAFATVACSKKGKDTAANPNGNGYYGTTPNDSHCMNGGYGGNYPGQHQGAYGYGYGYGYGQQRPMPNCPPQHGYMGGGNMFMGTCDLRFSGTSPLCPPGFYCQASYGPIGVCMRGY